MSERKVALITGAARRVGAALAREFAPDHDLLLHYGNSRAEAEALAAELSGKTRVALISADLRLPDAGELVAAAARNHQPFNRCTVAWPVRLVRWRTETLRRLRPCSRDSERRAAISARPWHDGRR